MREKIEGRQKTKWLSRVGRVIELTLVDSLRKAQDQEKGRLSSGIS